MTTFSVWECIVCGWVYDESLGSPDDGIVPRTLWEDIPEHWTCPNCSVTKQDFEMVKSGVSAAATTTAAAPAVEKQQRSKGEPAAAPATDDSGEPFQIWECVICG
ncbi:MAG: rubredoxin, partial [Porticoccaceae bacterium]|nr:rubredoxin [Porticoccaceae bacterium]